MDFSLVILAFLWFEIRTVVVVSLYHQTEQNKQSFQKHRKRYPMKNYLATTALALLVSLFSFAQSFNGTYTGTCQQQAVQLTLQQQGNNLAGTLQMSGDTYQLTGNTQSNTANGKAIGTQQDEWTFEAQTNSNNLNITFTTLWGLVTLPMQLQRTGGGNTTNASAQNNSSGFQQTTASAPNNIDPNLVGVWTKSSNINSGGYGNFASFSTETSFVLRANGTFEYGASRSVGGSDNWSYDGGGWSAPELTGTYFTQNGKIFIATANGQSIPKDKQLMGSYFVSNSGMSTTSTQGVKEYWAK